MRDFKRRVSDVEYKLRLLMSVDALQMATRDQLWPFLARLDMMDYVPMCLCVDELTRIGALAKGTGVLSDELYITDKGREYLRLFKRRMPAADCDRITRAAPGYLRSINAQRQLYTGYELPSDGMRRVRCTFRDGDVPTLALRVETPHDSIAQAAASRFAEVVPRLLNALYTLKTDAEAPQYCVCSDIEAALGRASAVEPVLCAHGKLEHSAVVRISCERASYVVALLLPCQDAAARWALAAMNDGQKIADRLTDELLRDEGRQ